MLVTSIFSFYHNVFYQLESGYIIYATFNLSSATILKLYQCKILLCKRLPFPKWQILDSSELKEFAYYTSEFDESGRKFL